jgi:hypothetical protein
MKLVFLLLLSSIYCSTPTPDPQYPITIPEDLFKRFLNVIDRINGFRKNQDTELYQLLRQSRVITALINSSSQHKISTANAVEELVKGEKLYSLKTAKGGTQPDSLIANLEGKMPQLVLPVNSYNFYPILVFTRILYLITFRLSEANADKDHFDPHLTVEQFMAKLTDLLMKYTFDPKKWNEEFRETIKEVHEACIKSATVEPDLEIPTPPVPPPKVIPLQPLYDQLKVLLKDQMNPKLFDLFIGLKEPEVIFRGQFGNLGASIQNMREILSPEKLFELKKDQQAPELISAIDDIQSLFGEIGLKIEALGGVYMKNDINYLELWAKADFPKFLEKLVSLLVAIKDADRTKFHDLASVQEICTSLEWILEAYTVHWGKWDLDNRDLIKSIHENCRHDLPSAFSFKRITDRGFETFVEACNKIHQFSGQQNQNLFNLLVDRKHFDALLRANVTFFGTLKNNISIDLLKRKLSSEYINLDIIFKLKSTVKTVSTLAKLAENAFKQLQSPLVKFEEFTQTLIELLDTISSANPDDYDYLIDTKELLESFEESLEMFTEKSSEYWSNPDDRLLVKDIYEACYNTPRSLEARKKSEELEKLKEQQPVETPVVTPKGIEPGSQPNPAVDNNKSSPSSEPGAKKKSETWDEEFQRHFDQEEVKIGGSVGNESDKPSEKDEFERFKKKLKDTKVVVDELPVESDDDLNNVTKNDTKTQKDVARDAETQKVKVNDSETQKVKVNDSETQKVKVNDAETQKIKVNDAEAQKIKVSDAETPKVKVNDTETQKVKVSDAETQKVKVSDAETPKVKVTDAETQKIKVNDAETQKDKTTDAANKDTKPTNNGMSIRTKIFISVVIVVGLIIVSIAILFVVKTILRGQSS